MNSSQIHLALTHIPVILSLTGLAIFFVSLFSKSQQAGRIALYILITAGLFTLHVFFTGEGAEEAVEKMPGVAGALIEKHEDAAKVSLWIILLTALLSLAALVRIKMKNLLPVLKFPVLILAVLSAGAMALTAHYGGQIRHTEINSKAVASAADGGEAAGSDHDNDD
jgi:uncharacterized membrane protein